MKPARIGRGNGGAGRLGRMAAALLLVALLAIPVAPGSSRVGHRLPVELASRTAEHRPLDRAIPGAPPVLAPRPDDWPTYLHDPQRTGKAANFTTIGPENVSSLQLAWTAGFNRSLLGSLIVVNGVAYVGSESGYFHALNATTGAQLTRPEWALPYLGNTSYSQCGAPNFIGVRNNGIVSTATYQNGTLYEAGGNTSFYVVSTNGTVLHRVDVGNGSKATPYWDEYNWASPLLYRGAAYYGTAALCEYNRGVGGQAEWKYMQGQLLEINLTSDQIVHEFNVTKGVSPADEGGSIWSTASVDPTTNLVWITTGNENQSTQTPANCEYPRSIVALNATTLAYVGSYQVGSSGGDADYGAGPTVFHAPNGRELVAAINKGGLLVALDATPPAASNCSSTLSKVWSYQFGDYSNPGPIAPASFDGRYLYAAGDGRSGNGSDEVVAFDPGNGTVAWTHWLNHPYPAVDHAGLVEANGLLYVAAVNDSTGSGAGPGGELQVLDTATGRELWRHLFNQSVSAAVVLAEGHLFVATGAENNSGPGFLDAFDLPAAISWINETGSEGPAPTPTSSWGGSVAWDPPANEYVAFGGCRIGECPSNQTWTFQNGSWANVTASAGAPPARDRGAMAYDLYYQGLVLFGGCGATLCPRNDTWLFANGSWTNLTTSVCGSGSACPPGVYSAALAETGTLPAKNGTALFGGCTNANCSQLSGVTYALLDTSPTWQKLSFTGGPAAMGEATAFDPGLPAVVVEGGRVPCHGTLCDSNATYRFDLSSGWAQLAGAGAAGLAPPAASGAVLVADGSGTAMTLEGGWNTSTNSTEAGSWQLDFSSGGSAWGVLGSGSPPRTLAWGAGAGSGGSVNPLVLGGAASPNGTPIGGWWEIGTADTLRERATPDPVVAGESLVLNGTAAGGIGPYLAYRWAFGNGSVVSRAAGVLSVAAPARGFVNGTAFVVDSDWAVGGSGFSVRVIPALRVSFAPSASPTEVGVPTTFTSHVPVGTPGGPFAVRWSFGDGTREVGATVVHLYAAAGVYPVAAVVSDSLGDVNSTTENVTVEAPVGISIALNRTALDVGESALLTPEVSGGVGPFVIAWSFSDGFGRAEGDAPLDRSFHSLGMVTAWANLTDSLGVTASASGGIAVFPVLSVGANASPPGRIPVGTVVQFEATALGGILGAGGPPFAWTFGDGSTGAGAIPSHVYRAAGTFVATVRTNDSTGATAATNLTVTVVATPPRGGTPPERAGTLLWQDLVLLGAVLGTAGAVALVLRHRRPSRPPTSPGPPRGGRRTG
jgi:outer membrane protein assembly factor BamB